MRVIRTTLIACLLIVSVGIVLSVLPSQDTIVNEDLGGDFREPWRPPHKRLPLATQVPGQQVIECCETIVRHKAGTVSQLLHQMMLPDASAKLAEYRKGCLRVLASQDSFREFFPQAPEFVYYGPHKEWEITSSHECRGCGEAHPDQLLACLARAGVSLDCSLETTQGPVTVATLLKSSRRLFVLDQELPWSVIAYVSYLPNGSEWKNRFGEKILYQDIAQRLVTEELGVGPCAGTHNLFALAYLLRANDQFGFLNASTERACEEYLQKASVVLTRALSDKGCCSENWARNNPSDDEGFDSMTINITAHHLEWMSLVAEPMRPPDSAVALCVRFLCNAVRHQTDAAVTADLPGSVHAAVALQPFVINDMLGTVHKGE